MSNQNGSDAAVANLVQLNLEGAKIKRGRDRAHTIPSDSLSLAMAHIRTAMTDALIYSAALKGSKCELARSIGERLGLGYLHNDLDCAREALEEAQEVAP